MTDTLGGVQRHSSDAFWAHYKFITLERIHPEDYIHTVQKLRKSGVRFAPQHLYRKGVKTFALLVNVEDGADVMDLLLDWGIAITSVYDLPEAEGRGDRIMYDSNGSLLGFIVSLGTNRRHQWGKFVVFDVNTGEYFEPRTAGFLTPHTDADTPKYTRAVNAPSVGARYRDQA